MGLAPSLELLVAGLVGIYLLVYAAAAGIARAWYFLRASGGRPRRGRTALVAAIAYCVSSSVLFLNASSGYVLPAYAFLVVGIAVGLAGLRFLVISVPAAPAP